VLKRTGNDLRSKIKISLIEALAGTTIELKRPDGTEMKKKIDEVIFPGFVLEIPGEGMPILGTQNKKGCFHFPFGLPIWFPSTLFNISAIRGPSSFHLGSLIIEFLIEFPKHLSKEKKELLKKILNEEQGSKVSREKTKNTFPSMTKKRINQIYLQGKHDKGRPRRVNE